MGLDHYLRRPDTLPPDRFSTWSRDVRRVLDALPPAMIRGEYGEGEPTITDELVAFNGNAVYRVPHAEDSIAVYSDAALLATYPAPDEWNSDRRNPFHVARVFDQHFRDENEQGWLWDSFRTQQNPYDRAVVAALILFAHHLPGMCKVSSDYAYEDWRPGLALAREATGLDVHIPFYFRGVERPRVLPDDVFRAWRDDVTRVIAVAGVPLAGPDGTGEPVLTGDTIAFNGVGSDGAGCLRISREYDPADGGGRGWNDERMLHFISTHGNQGKRYDIVVAAALVLLADRFPLQDIYHGENSVTFEGVALFFCGLGSEEWLPGAQLAANATGREIQIPRGFV